MATAINRINSWIVLIIQTHLISHFYKYKHFLNLKKYFQLGYLLGW